MVEVTWQIDNARLDDLERLVALLAELLAIEADFCVDPEKQRRGIRLMLDGCGKHRCVKVVRCDQQVVGMCTAQLLVSTAEGALTALVENLVVTEKMRGLGIGSALLEAVETWALGHGATRLQLAADKKNEQGLAFYEKHCWRTTRLICLHKMPG